MDGQEKTLETIKTALRLTTNELDEELKGLIAAGLEDLQMSGVINPFEQEPMVLLALINFAKANFGFSEFAQQFQGRYDTLKNALRLDVSRNA